MNDRDLAEIETAAGILRRMIAGGDTGNGDAEGLARRIYVLAGRVFARPVIVRAERVRLGPDEWLDGDRREPVGEFETGEEDGGVISLEEFCERAGLELRLT